MMMMMSSINGTPSLNSVALQANLAEQAKAPKALNATEVDAKYLKPSTREEERLKKVAQDFEALFMNQLLSAMDKTVDREESMLSAGGEGGGGENTFRGMMYQEMSTAIAKQPGAGASLGLAKTVFAQGLHLLQSTPAAEQPATAAAFGAQALKAFDAQQKPLALPNPNSLLGSV
jgi:Rod binding domain-containing protein